MKYIDKYKEELKKYILENKLTYFIETFGCAMNENDSMKYAGVIETLGFKKSKNLDDANLVLLNTCAIRENAENTLYGRLGFLKNKKIKNSKKYIVVVGCMSQQKHVVEKIENTYKHVDIVLGTHAVHLFPKMLYSVIFKKNKMYNYGVNDIVDDIPIKYDNKLKASVSIIYGCNNFCSYCIVPYVRGREKSRKSQDIIKDVKKITELGYKEITLLGQNVNSYGKDLKEDINFAKLLLELEKIDGIEIIKFISPHPKDFTDELIDVISKSKKISKQIHLPLQSGSNKILKLMNRKYTKESFLELFNKIKAKVEDVVFSTDIIVGFPGETYEDFKETLDVVKKVEFDQIYMFIFSKRKGTKAYEMVDNLSKKEKSMRLEELKNISKNITNKNNELLIGKVYKILVEGKSKNNENLYTGRTNFNKVVIFEGNDNDIGEIINIKIIKNNLWYLTGEKINY